MNDLNFLEKDGAINEITLLSRTIESFNGAAFKFETYYRHLEKKVEELYLELEIKNAELKKNLKEKEEAQNYLRNILESLTTGVVVINPNGIITTFNRAAEKITGIKLKYALGKKIESVFRQNLFPKLCSETNLIKSFEKKETLETEVVRNEKDALHVSISTFPVEDFLGEKIGTAFTIQDITQLKKLEEKANRTDKLAAMGEMAAEIAHEIRNPLGSIELFATTLKRDLEGLSDLQSLTEHISSGVRSLNNIVSNLLLFVSPQQRSEFKVVDIISILNESLFITKHLIENNHIELFTRYSNKSLGVMGDSDLIKQALLNVILNAIQAMPDGGRLNIVIKNTNDVTEKGLDLVEVIISDTGTGVSDADKARIFDPFFTTKKKGTGLGLTIVHNILEIHDADIDIESSNKGGTICTVKFPLWKVVNEDY